MPPRLVVLKARQVGVSTLVEGILFWMCLCFENRSTLVVAHVLKSAKVLFKMGRNFYRRLPRHMRQVTRADSTTALEFDSGSSMQVEVQGDPRGYAALGVHLSEFAFYMEPEKTLVAILQTLPRVLYSLGVIESTANGVGNKFHQLWQRASGNALDDEVPDDEKGWTPVFIPWYRHEEYEIPIEGTFTPTSDESALMLEHPEITHTKLKWRRWCISANLDGDEDKFAQEYPSTPEEAFALSGRPAFDTKAVADYTKKLNEYIVEKKMPPRCELEVDPPGEGKIEIIVYDKGRLRIFFEPQDRHTYILGADPSEGDPGSDHSPLAVLDQQTMDLSATWYGKAPPDVLALHAIDLGRHYGMATIIGEANQHGILFNETLMQQGYPNMYFRRVSEDSVAGTVTDKPGYLSTPRTREYLFNTLRKFVRMRMGKLYCPNFVRQLQTLVYVERGKGVDGSRAEAQAGAEKDLLIAFALCLMCHRGSMKVPLAPHPEELMRAAVQEIALLKERDPDAAKDRALVLTGMTMDEVLAQEDAILAREERQRRSGIARMR